MYTSDDESDEIPDARPSPSALPDGGCSGGDGGGLVLVGSVDGIVEEIDARASDAAAWRTVRVIVEVKNRMRHVGAARPIALHDEIQMVVYVPDATCNAQRATCNGQRATGNQQHARSNGQQHGAKCNRKQATCNHAHHASNL